MCGGVGVFGGGEGCGRGVVVVMEVVWRDLVAILLTFDQSDRVYRYM